MGGKLGNYLRQLVMVKAALASVRSIDSEWLRDANSFLVSAIIHLVALVLLALLMMTNDKGWSGLNLVAQMADGIDAPLGSGESFDESIGSFQVETEDAASAAGPITLFDNSSAMVASTSAIESPLDALSSGGLEGTSIGDGSGGSLAGGGGGDGSGGAQFFGIGGKGGTFVYVVDMSGSMNEEGKWERARAELLRSIEHLTENQRYYIIFYNDGWYPMSGDKPVDSTAKNIDRTRRWVSRLWPGGGTFPLEALLFALKLEPDAVYFLSDGRFDPAVIEAIRVQNPSSTGQIPIHTVAFVNQETIPIMKQIADQSGGKFRFVQ
ncbi:MAG: hypothetical protein AB7G28_05155 [Pirellulales bacterium]